MDNQKQSAVMDARRVLRELRGLGDVTPPPSLAPVVMTRLGLGDAYTTLDSPLGTVVVAYNSRGISLVTRSGDAAVFEDLFRRRFGRPVYHVAAAPSWLRRVLAGEERGQDARVDLRGLSEFEQAVLRKAGEIPRGEVRPYAWVAREIGRPAAVRAVGSALGHNPVPLVIPCHRVVRSDGYLGQYSLGGAEAKRTVLEAEGVGLDSLGDWASRGLRYVGSDSTHVFCYPTCRHARRITERHRVAFHTSDEAVAAGYRPCAVCRPAVATAIG